MILLTFSQGPHLCFYVFLHALYCCQVYEVQRSEYYCIERAQKAIVLCSMTLHQNCLLKGCLKSCKTGKVNCTA